MWKSIFYLFLLIALPYTFKAFVAPLLVPIGFVLTLCLIVYLAT